MRSRSMAWCLRVLAVVGFVCPVHVIAVPPPEILAARQARRAHRGDVQHLASEAPNSGVSVAAGFNALNVALLSHVPNSDFANGGGGANDIWGYASPSGREYAIIGLEGSTGFVDITDPTRPAIIADIPDFNSLWSDIAVFGQFAYNVNESGGGIQIFDLGQIDNGIVTLVGSAVGSLTTAHNIYANPDSGYLYPCMTNFTSGFAVYDLADPSNPVPVSVWSNGCVHDLLVVNYASCPYAGRAGACEIAFLFGCGSGLTIVDVTDKMNMVTVSSGTTYPNIAFTHQGWLSESRKFLFVDDELDESSFGNPTTTYVFNVEDLANPFLVTTFGNGLRGIDHNLMVRGDFVFEANYVNGLRVFRAGDADILNNTVQEVGFFDTSPIPDSVSFGGAWGIYSGLPSGVVLVSDEQQGLFVLDASAATGCLANQQCDDGNPCTDDICTNGTCSSSNLAVGVACDDGNSCTINGQCDGAGVCVVTPVDSIACVDDSVCFNGTCDVVAGFCRCVPCVQTMPPLPEDVAVLKNRFLSFQPTNAGQMTALEVRFANLPAPYDLLNGQSMWVGPPSMVSESGASVDPVAGSPNFTAATLQCEPFFADWGAMGPLDVYHAVIVPGGEYSVRAIGEGCVTASINDFSSPLSMATATFGDVVNDLTSSPPGPPDGAVVIADVLAVIQGFGSVPGAARKARTDLEPGTPDLLINISDVLVNLSAFSGVPYPFPLPPGPPPCP